MGVGLSCPQSKGLMFLTVLVRLVGLL